MSACFPQTLEIYRDLPGPAGTAVYSSGIPFWQSMGFVLLSVLLSMTEDPDHQQELDCELVSHPILILKTEAELSGNF